MSIAWLRNVDDTVGTHTVHIRQGDPQQNPTAMALDERSANLTPDGTRFASGSGLNAVPPRIAPQCQSGGRECDKSGQLHNDGRRGPGSGKSIMDAHEPDGGTQGQTDRARRLKHGSGQHSEHSPEQHDDRRQREP